jgi:translation initiation factor IF-1
VAVKEEQIEVSGEAIEAFRADEVRVELLPYILTRGRIVFRHRNEQPRPA